MDIESANPQQSGGASQESIWRDGPYLVVRRKKSQFPDRCILCNAPAEGKRLSFHVRDPQAILESDYVKVGLCPTHRSKEVWGQLRAWMIVLLGVGISGLSVFIENIGIRFVQEFVAGLGILAIVAGWLLLKLHPNLVTAKRIDRGFIWLEDIHPDYLAGLPDVAEES